MKTKATSNTINPSLPQSISRCTHFLKSKIFSIYLPLILAFVTTISFGQTNSCTADLRVEKDRNIRSTPLDGTYYSMLITNSGTSADTYHLFTSNINNSCTNTDGSSTANNVALNTTFIDTNKNPISKVSVNPGDSVNFFIKVTVPVGTTLEKWCCTQVTAQSKTCDDYTVNTVLHTYVIDSSKD
jgi:hypothetical protein